MRDKTGKAVLNTVSGYVHIYPCPSINPTNKRLENWITFNTIKEAKEYAPLAKIKIRPCVCAMEAFYVNNR